MKTTRVLIVGGGIGGLTLASALAGPRFDVTVIERDGARAVDGVGILQQANVVRAMASIGLVDKYLEAGFPFYWQELYTPDGELLMRNPLTPAVEGFPPSLGIGRRALREALLKTAVERGAIVRDPLTVSSAEDDGEKVDVVFSDGERGTFDVVVGADGIYSQMRAMLFPDLPGPEFTGQAVWRYNLPRPEGFDAMRTFSGPKGLGLVPIDDERIYIFVTTPEPGNPPYPRQGLAAQMRERLAGSAPQIMEICETLLDDSAVVYRPLETMFVRGDWHRGRMVLLGDAVHAMTPHQGQGGGMAIEDAVVLAEELARHEQPQDAFAAYQARRFERCRMVFETSLAICHMQLGKGPALDYREVGAAVQSLLAEPI